MQTFLPYEDFVQSASALDRNRLNKQHMETYEILLILLHIKHIPHPVRPDFIQQKRWDRLVRHSNHPAVVMWDGYTESLINYGITVCNEWIKRGYQDVMAKRISDLRDARRPLRVPPWLNDHRIHSTHRAALLYKDPKWYSKFNWTETPSLRYFWPGRDYVTEN